MINVDFVQHSKRILVVLTIVCVAVFDAAPSQAQTSESFEDGKPRWQLQMADSKTIRNSWVQEISTNEQHSGNSSEHIRFQGAVGKKATISFEPAPIFAIAELVPSVWIKSEKADLQIRARVVLPHSRVPGDDRAFTVMIDGPVATRSTNWQKLTFATHEKNIAQLVEQKIWLLREKFRDAEINARNAYVDLLMLTAFPQHGTNDIYIDDLKIEGTVSAEQIARQVRRNGAVVKDNNIGEVSGTQEKPESFALQKGSVIEVKSRPFAVRAIQHNGESLESLQQLGFNTIEMKREPDGRQLAEAARLGLWIICPPPKQIGLQPLDQSYDRVLAWSLGPSLTDKDIPQVRQTVNEIRHSDYRRQRPVMVDVESNWSAFGRIGSIVSVSREPIGSSFPLREYDQWLKKWRKAAGNPPLLVGVQTELSQDLVSQVSAISNRVPPSPLSPQQMQYAVYEAVAGGARGVRFMSRSRLDADDPSSRLRAATLRWLNQQLIQIQPWIAGGAVMDDQQTGYNNLDVVQVKTDRARLLLVQKSTGNEQWFAGDAVTSAKNFSDRRAIMADQAYWISDQGLLPKSTNSTVGGLQIDLSETGVCSLFVVTQSPIAINQLSRSYSIAGRQTRGDLQAQLTQNWLAIVQLLAAQTEQSGGGNVSIRSHIQQATQFAQQASTLTNSRSLITANRFWAKSDHQIALARRELMLGAQRNFASPTASPLTMHCSLVPSHWNLISRIGQTDWNPNGLAGGDFENLGHMQKNGWKNQRTDNSQFATQVELSADAAVAGSLGLKLVAQKRDPASLDVVEHTPVWITTGKVPVRAGQFVRIHGWINIPDGIQGSPDGVLITDSLGGKAIGERIRTTNGWREFTMYRGASQNGDIEVKIALTGLGTVLLDEITIRTIDLPVPGRRANALNNSSR